MDAVSETVRVTPDRISRIKNNDGFVFRDRVVPIVALAELMMSVKNQKAIAAGLTFRPLADTIRDTLAWWPTVPEARRAKPRFTISPEMEAKALADWHAVKG